MKLSARNVIDGVVTSRVRLEIGGTIITASITNEALPSLALQEEQKRQR